MRFLRKSEPSGRRRPSRSAEQNPVGSKFSYRARRSTTEENIGRQVQREERSAQIRSRNILRKTGLIVLLAASLVLVFKLLSLSAQPKIQILKTDKPSVFLRQPSVYQGYARVLLGQSIWNGNKVTVNSEDIAGKMLDKFPELADASMTVSLFSYKPTIYIQPARPSLVVSARNGAFVVASGGKALLRQNSADSLKNLKLPLLEDQSVLKLTVGQQALTAGNVKFIETVAQQLVIKGTKIEKMTLPAATSELDVYLEGKPYLVKFNLAANTARQQAGTYLATAGYLKKHNTMPAKYIDVRADGRAYYK